jgi:5-methyltetrahydrofolate--homocysteine methyltransferase
MTPSVIDVLSERVLVGDGAMGTELMSLGLPAGACPESWNLTRPEAVRSISQSYVAAGADVVHTNTLGANRWVLDRYDLHGQAARINASAAQIAREAAGERAYVVGEMGPTGRFMAPVGDEPRHLFVEVFAEQASALAAAGVDALLLETFISLDEALAALEAARMTGLAVIASMSYTPGADGTCRTVMGETLPAAVAALEAAGTAVVGANCAVGADQYPAIARTLCFAATVPCMVQPNAGMPSVVQGRTAFPMSPEEMAACVPAILAAGVRIIGGCCGTTSEHIRAIRRAVDEARPF